MGQPSDLPTWAEGTGAAVVQPPTASADSGWVPDQHPPAEWFNWLFRSIGRWCNYLKTLTAEQLTWTARQDFNAGATCANPVQDTDVANKGWVIAQMGAGGGTPQNYVPNTPYWLQTTYSPLKFWKDANGDVNFVGQLQCATSDPTKEIGILPVGMRPPVSNYILATIEGPREIRVDANGYMYLLGLTSLPVAFYLNFSGAKFHAL